MCSGGKKEPLRYGMRPPAQTLTYGATALFPLAKGAVGLGVSLVSAFDKLRMRCRRSSKSRITESTADAQENHRTRPSRHPAIEAPPWGAVGDAKGGNIGLVGRRRRHAAKTAFRRSQADLR